MVTWQNKEDLHCFG